MNTIRQYFKELSESNHLKIRRDHHLLIHKSSSGSGSLGIGWGRTYAIYFLLVPSSMRPYTLCGNTRSPAWVIENEYHT